MYSNLAVNKYLHTVASCWISSTYNYDARNHEHKEYEFEVRVTDNGLIS